MQFRDLLGFEKLVTPPIIRFVYWIGIIAGVLFGVGGSLMLLTQGMVLNALLYLAATILGLLGWRILCELYIVAFGIYDRLGHIRDTLASASNSRQTPQGG